MFDSYAVAAFVVTAPLADVRAIRRAAKTLTRAGFTLEEAINLLLEKRNSRVNQVYAREAR